MTQATCIKVEKHPNADKLMVYGFCYLDVPLNLYLDGPHLRDVQIVANLTNVYEIGDLVNIVLPGETYEGILIEPRKVRGVDSFGMAVGKV